jgi:CRP-like cAMP-binding protein
LEKPLMINSLIMKLRHGAQLTKKDYAKLQTVTAQTRRLAAHVDIIHEEEPPDDVRLVLDGFACRYKALPNGGRSIVAFLVPGDFCDLHVAILGAMDHSIATLTPCTLVDIPRETIQELTTGYPCIARALWWATLVDGGILREWIVSMGQRPADQQLAHLFCEMLVRLQTVQRADVNSCILPFTQEELADALGISAVHANRVLQQLRNDGLAVLRDKLLTIPDVGRLKKFADFNPNYLHLKDVAAPADIDQRDHE